MPVYPFFGEAPVQQELGEGDPWNSICGSIFPFMGKTRYIMELGDPPPPYASGHEPIFLMENTAVRLTPPGM